MTFSDLKLSWTRIVGPLVSAVSWPAMLTESGTLVINTGAPFTDELRARDAEILAALPAIDGHAVVALRWNYVAAERTEHKHHRRRAW